MALCWICHISDPTHCGIFSGKCEVTLTQLRFTGKITRANIWSVCDNKLLEFVKTFLDIVQWSEFLLSILSSIYPSITLHPSIHPSSVSIYPSIKWFNPPTHPEDLLRQNSGGVWPSQNRHFSFWPLLNLFFLKKTNLFSFFVMVGVTSSSLVGSLAP